jgi:uncharacterized protein YdiU (UPF0061 family)
VTTLSAAPGRTLEQLRFTNGFAGLPPALFEERAPDGLTDARLVATSPAAAELLDLRADQLGRGELTRIVAGTALLEGMHPIATLYGGHQFGVWAGQLGDGRALLLGEVTNARGERWELQLKGAGQTAFSRFADGRAVLRSTIREFAASEALDALGIPTTRALALVAADVPVMRETIETAAIVLRLAPTFVRFGSFEILAARQQSDLLRALLDYTIAGFFPHCGTGEDRYARFFAEVVERTASLMADWQAVGFMHGVMNTDNFSILGLTLDYGPYGFMEAYDPHHICNHSDHHGRYAYDQQPGIGLWNCYALANALTQVVEQAALERALEGYRPAFQAAYRARFTAKLGLEGERDGDEALIAELLRLMAAAGADFSRTFRMLGELRRDGGALGLAHRTALVQTLGAGAPAHAWVERYAGRIADDPRPDAARTAALHAVNPRVVLRNHLAQEVIEAAQAGDDAPLQRLLAALRRPYADEPAVAAYDRLAPTDRPPVEVSCSS